MNNIVEFPSAALKPAKLPQPEVKDRFEVGQSYVCRSPGDCECVWVFKVLSRTASTVVIQEDGRSEKPVRRRIQTKYSSSEYVMPFGSYSLAPGLYADKCIRNRKRNA